MTVPGLALLMAPGAAHAGLFHGAHLSTDIISESAMTALAHDGKETPLNWRMDVAVISLERPVLSPTMQGRALLGLDFQHAGVNVGDANNWTSNPQDHYSIALNREIFAGAHLSYPLSRLPLVPALPMGTRLFAGAGALRTELLDRAVIGAPLRNRDRVMGGWRIAAGAEAPMGAGRLRLEYRLSRSSDTIPGEAAALASSARDKVMLSFNAIF